MFKATLFTFILFFAIVAVPNRPIFAACPPDCTTGEKVGSTTSLTNPIGVTDVPTLIGKVIKAALGIVGSLALLMFIYGGFMWMLSGGNEKMIEKGKTTLMWAALGLVLIFTSYALVNFVINTATSKG